MIEEAKLRGGEMWLCLTEGACFTSSVFNTARVH